LTTLTAPFPWFGGKRRAAHLIWPRFGNVPNYVEPFAGSLAVLLAREDAPGTETVNDRDAYLANFWRAVQAEPDAVWGWCDAPVIEADLHARHVWLLQQTEFRERMLTDPTFYDIQIAGWWVWGLSLWIGDGWCAETNERTNERKDQTVAESAVPQVGGARRPHRKIPELGSDRGVRRGSFQNSRRHAVCSVSQSVSQSLLASAPTGFSRCPCAAEGVPLTRSLSGCGACESSAATGAAS
jgi:hypothetical protein